VVTFQDSLEAAQFVAQTGAGQVLDSEAALAALFASGAIHELSRTGRQRMLHDLDWSRMSVDLLEPGR
jgi:hypothetical protein